MIFHLIRVLQLFKENANHCPLPSNTSDTHGGISPEMRHSELFYLSEPVPFRVFALTHEDARAVVLLNQISGAGWMLGGRVDGGIHDMRDIDLQGGRPVDT